MESFDKRKKTEFSVVHGRRYVFSCKHSLRIIFNQDPGTPDVTPGPSIGPSTNTQLPPLIHSSESKSLPPTTTEDTFHTDSDMMLGTKSAMPSSEQPSIAQMGLTTTDSFHTEMIPSTDSEPAMPTSESSTAQMDIETTANPSMQIGRSDGDLDGQLPATAQAEDTFHAEMIVSTGTESATGMQTGELPPAPMDVATSNSGMQIGCSDGDLDGPTLGEMPSEGKLPDDFHSRNSPNLRPGPLRRDSEHETDSHKEIPPVCGPPQINNQQSTEGDGRASTVKNDSDIVEHSSSSRKGKRKMIDRVGESIATGDGGFKRNRTITIVPEDSDSDIEYLGSWRPNKRTNIIQTAVKTENVPIKLENLVSDSDVSTKF